MENLLTRRTHGKVILFRVIYMTIILLHGEKMSSFEKNQNRKFPLNSISLRRENIYWIGKREKKKGVIVLKHIKSLFHGSFKPLALKGWLGSESPGEFIRTQTVWPHLQSFWYNRCGVEAENLHFYQVPKWCDCCSENYT